MARALIRCTVDSENGRDLPEDREREEEGEHEQQHAYTDQDTGHGVTVWRIVTECPNGPKGRAENVVRIPRSGPLLRVRRRALLERSCHCRHVPWPVGRRRYGCFKSIENPHLPEESTALQVPASITETELLAWSAT